MNRVSILLQFEEQQQEILKQAIQSLVTDVREVRLDDVKKVNPMVSIVRLSTLCKNDCWLPEYYSADRQADLLQQYLSSVTTAHGLFEKLQKILCSKQIKVAGNNYRLHSQVLEKIEDFITNSIEGVAQV